MLWFWPIEIIQILLTSLIVEGTFLQPFQIIHRLMFITPVDNQLLGLLICLGKIKTIMLQLIKINEDATTGNRLAVRLAD